MKTVTTARHRPIEMNGLRFGARDDERQAEEEQRRVEKRLHEAGVDGDADVGAEVGAGAAELADHFARRGEVAPGGAGREELERHAADDEDLIGLRASRRRRA